MNVRKYSDGAHTSLYIRGFIPERNLINVTNVAKPLIGAQDSLSIRRFTWDRPLTSVNVCKWE